MPKLINSLFDIIEAPQYTVNLGLISVLPQLIRQVHGTKEYSIITNEFYAQSNKAKIVRRIRRLLRTESKTEYAHPKDLPIAFYLIVLFEGFQYHSLRLAAQIARVENLWWSQQLARSILDQPVFHLIDWSGSNERHPDAINGPLTTKIIPITLDNLHSLPVSAATEPGIANAEIGAPPISISDTSESERFLEISL